ncbi:MAG: hypothetical protein ABI191_06480, partial [Rhizomicrobium sp.]
MRTVHSALFGIAALLCAATAVQSQQQNMAAVDPAPPSADAAPSADMPAAKPAPAAAAPAASPAAAAPAATPAPSAVKAATPAAKPPQKSAALEPKKKVYRPTLIPAEPDNTDSDGIAATVNDISVSEFEVRQRMALF